MPNPYETWGKYSPHEVIIFPKFHKNWAKIVDFLTWAIRFQNRLSYNTMTLLATTVFQTMFAPG